MRKRAKHNEPLETPPIDQDSEESLSSNKGFWRVVAFLTGLIAVTQVYLLYSDFKERAANAIADGTQVRVNLQSGEIMIRKDIPEIKEYLSEPVAKSMQKEGSDEDLLEATPIKKPIKKASSQTANADISSGDYVPPLLPVISPNNFTKRLAIMFRGLGLQTDVTKQVLDLSPDIALAFSPYAPDLIKWADLSQTAGFSLYLDTPSSTFDFPYEDAGRLALLVTNTEQQNLYRLGTMLKLADFKGILMAENEDITFSTNRAVPIIDFLAKKGLSIVYNEESEGDNAYLHGQALSIQMPHVRRYIALDSVATSEFLYEKMVEIRKLINSNDQDVVIVARPYPLSIELIANLATEFVEAGYNFYSVSEIAKK